MRSCELKQRRLDEHCLFTFGLRRFLALLMVTTFTAYAEPHPVQGVIASQPSGSISVASNNIPPWEQLIPPDLLAERLEWVSPPELRTGYSARLQLRRTCEWSDQTTTTTILQHYTEAAAGLNYFDGRSWAPSRITPDLLPDGRVTLTRRQVPVEFAPNANTERVLSAKRGEQWMGSRWLG